MTEPVIKAVGNGGIRPRPQGANPAAMTPRDVFLIVRRHICLIVFGTFLGFLVGGSGWYLLQKYYPTYRAQAYIEVLPPGQTDPMMIANPFMNKDIQYQNRVSFTQLIKSRGNLNDLVNQDDVQSTQWFKSFAKGRSKSERISKAADGLEDDFGVAAMRDASFISLSMRCHKAEEAKLIVDQMIDLFLRKQIAGRRGDVGEKITSLMDRRDIVQGELSDTEESLDAIRRVSGFADLEIRGGAYRNTLEIKLDDLESSQNDLLLEMQELKGTIRSLERQATGIIEDTEQVERQVERDPIMRTLANQIAVRQSILAGMLTKFGDNHRAVKTSRTEIGRLKEERQLRKIEIAEQVRKANLQDAKDALVALEDRRIQLEELRQETSARKKQFDIAKVQYAKTVTIRDERKDVLNDIKEQIEKYRILQQDPESSKLQFVSYAALPMELSSPKWELYFPGGTMFGLMLGLGLAFLIEMLNDLIRTPRDVIKFLHIPLLGVIPDISEDDDLEGVKPCNVVSSAPFSMTSESYRRLRANLRLADQSEFANVWMIASGKAGEGKTSVAVNMAMSFVAEAKKVLLINTNFRRKPGLQAILQTPENQPDSSKDGQSETESTPALSAFLQGRTAVDEIIRPCPAAGLDIIDAGQLPSNPAELLGGSRMEELIKDVRERYDNIIIDTPASLLVSDAKVVTKFVDGTILVFNAGITRRGVAMRTVREFREAKAGIIGGVLVAVKAMKGGYFREQSKSYRNYHKAQLAGVR